MYINGFNQLFPMWQTPNMAAFSMPTLPVPNMAAYSMPNFGMSTFGAPAMYNAFNPTGFGTPLDGMFGAARVAVGEVKMMPGIGNIANGVDFVRDLGQMGRALSGDPTQSIFKKGADLLFHGLGVIAPQIGGSYDIAQGTTRQYAAASNPFNYGGWNLPAFNFNYGGYPSYYQPWVY
jgi:hypothetical protein